jgi:hypothetical protein
MTCVAARPMAWVVFIGDNPRIFETATAAPIDPTVEVICLEDCKLVKYTDVQMHTYQPTS